MELAKEIFYYIAELERKNLVILMNSLRKSQLQKGVILQCNGQSVTTQPSRHS